MLPQTFSEQLPGSLANLWTSKKSHLYHVVRIFFHLVWPPTPQRFNEINNIYLVVQLFIFIHLYNCSFFCNKITCNYWEVRKGILLAICSCHEVCLFSWKCGYCFACFPKSWHMGRGALYCRCSLWGNTVGGGWFGSSLLCTKHCVGGTGVLLICHLVSSSCLPFPFCCSHCSKHIFGTF